MKRFVKIMLAFVFATTFFTPTARAQAATETIITTTPTGYTCAEDVEYETTSGNIHNWGARGEDCVFLSEYAEDFYTGSNTYENLSKKSGGSSQSNAYTSALYSSLKNLMKNKHDHETSYNETRDLYRYTDCVSNNSSKISSFYSGIVLKGTWDSGKTWNREHTWPNSKGLDGNDENDIMMLRPTSVSENSSRGNKAYGESSSYYNPGKSTRGDCARIVLYVYTRWGNTGKMWGTSGVMENLNVLLDWMEEDPVDTWEMGRNDAVQSITGTRNVFVDYPEYAWLLFGREIPDGMSTPSGAANEGFEEESTGSESSSSQSSMEDVSSEEASSSSQSSMEDVSSEETSSSSQSSMEDVSSEEASNSSQSSMEDVSSEEASSSSQSSMEDVSSEDADTSSDVEIQSGTVENSSSVNMEEHIHDFGQWEVVKEPTETSKGLRSRKCSICGYVVAESIPTIGGNNDSLNEIENLAGNCNASLSVCTGITLLSAALVIFKKKED